jgi:hypothetical protein
LRLAACDRRACCLPHGSRHWLRWAAGVRPAEGCGPWLGKRRTRAFCPTPYPLIITPFLCTVRRPPSAVRHSASFPDIDVQRVEVCQPSGDHDCLKDAFTAEATSCLISSARNECTRSGCRHFITLCLRSRRHTQCKGADTAYIANKVNNDSGAKEMMTKTSGMTDA